MSGQGRLGTPWTPEDDGFPSVWTRDSEFVCEFPEALPDEMKIAYRDTIIGSVNNCAGLTDQALAANVVPRMVAAVRAFEGFTKHKATCVNCQNDIYPCSEGAAFEEAMFDNLRAAAAGLGEG